MQLKSHTVKTSIAKNITARFDGFSSAAFNQRVSEEMSNGSQKWFISNQSTINIAVQNIFWNVVDNIVRNFNLNSLILAISSYNSTGICI